MSETPLALRVLEILPQAVSVVDGAGRLAYANAAFWRDAGVEPAACPVGSPLRDLVRLLAYRGLYGAGDPEAQVDAVLALDRSRPSRRQIGLPDGSRSFETVSLPLGGGGFVNVAHDITALIRGREEQASRARLLEATLAGLRGGVLRMDAELRVALFNPAYEALLGLPGGTLRSGMTLQEVFELLDARGEFETPGTAAASAARIAGNRDRPVSRQRQRPTGAVLRFDSQPTADGGFLTEVADVTALKRAEDEARRRAAMLDGVLDALPHAVCVYGPDRRVQMFNRAYARMMQGTTVTQGEALEDVLARRLAQGEYDEAAVAQIRARFAPGVTEIPVMRRVRPNGMVIESNMATLPDGGVISVFTDVTALHRAEGAARQRAALLDGVVEAMPHGVCVYGPDRRVAMFNEAYRRIMQGAEIAVGDHVDLVVARRIAEGEFGADYGAVTMARSHVPTDRTEEIVRSRPNGTVISIRTAKLPDGGHISVVTDVTALHRAEEAARERAELLDAVLDALPEGVVVYGPDTRARMTNPAYRRLLGDAAIRIGESFEELAQRHIEMGEQTPDIAEALVRRHHGPADNAAEPIRRIRHDGTAIVTRAGRLPDGGHIAVLSDITRLHRAEEELRRRAAMLEASFASMRHGIAIFGPDRRLLAANDRTPALTGVPKERYLPGRSFEELVDEQVATGVLTPLRGEVAKAVDRTRPHRFMRESERQVVEVLSDPTEDGGFVVTFADVTALHRAEAELRQRAAMQAAMLGTIRHGIVLYGPDRRALAANAKTFELTGTPPDLPITGRLMDDLLDEQVARGQLSVAQATMMKEMDRNRPQRYTRSRADGRMLDTVSEPTPDGGFVITYSDVTEERTIRAELERARAQAEAASEAKSRFLATMSHELRTPLNAVIGLSEAIGLDADRPRTEEYATMINAAGRQLLRLVDDILDVARSDTGALAAAAEPVAPAAVIAAAAKAFAPAATEAGLVLRTELPPRLPQLRGDARRLQQALEKLLSNAVKFTPAGGSVEISATVGQDGLEIRVADTGIGIPTSERERMFEPFTQLDSSLARRFQGSGLGLHLARSLAVALGGTLTLDAPKGSGERQGTVAVLRFPPERLIAAPEAVPLAAGTLPA
ncbi:MAG TPA: PAS-domain containing protein [Falsiroseomonas sp.]|jgi:signal transduction histidine kinase|nr:PAS-domain containing protein [Falsiroseomonas sp.]